MNHKPTPQQLADELNRQRSATTTQRPIPITYNIYVLRLKDGCYYVGLSKDVHWRVGRHASGRGAAWTRLHPVIEHIDSFQCYTCDERTAMEHEDEITIRYMRQHGWKKVRGGRFCEVDELSTEKHLRHHQIFEHLNAFYFAVRTKYAIDQR
jgi:predicted GIY-YIG superfamily endonuclease